MQIVDSDQTPQRKGEASQWNMEIWETLLGQ